MRDGSQIHSTLSARITSQDCSLAPPPLRGWAGSFYPAGMARTTQYLSRMTRTQTASSQREKGITLCNADAVQKSRPACAPTAQAGCRIIGKKARISGRFHNLNQERPDVQIRIFRRNKKHLRRVACCLGFV